jgi:hypothetical protein
VTTFKILKIDWHKGGESQKAESDSLPQNNQTDLYQSDLSF